MSYFRRLDARLAALAELVRREERWLICINADPDALASAMALKRMMSRRCCDVGIAHVNEITRPDNLAMIRYLRIPLMKLTPNVAAQYDRFALVDSQPHHHEAFQATDFSLVMDHHPLSKEHPVTAEFTDLKPEYGANATLLTEYLYNMDIRPGKYLATALLYGIKTDTGSFERDFHDADVKAFRWLSKLANHDLLRKIVRSEFKLDWLDYFYHGMENMRVDRSRLSVFMGLVENPDVLVILADFFLRVHEITWTIVGGVYDDKLVVIFRGSGLSRDMGKLAQRYFGDVGSAGGHRTMARAEVPMEVIGEGSPDLYFREKIKAKGRVGI